MPIERPAGDELAHGPLAAVGGLHVVEHGTTRPAVVEADPPGGVDRFGPDVESEDHVVGLQSAPDRLPLLVLPRRTLNGRADGEEPELEAEIGRPLDLGDRVVDIEQRDGSGQYEARRLALEVNEEVVRDAADLALGPGGGDVE